MTVLCSAVGRVRPGRYRDFLSQALEAVEHYERLGAQTPRLLRAAVAGQGFGTWSFTSEFSNIGAYGEFSDRLRADHEMQDFLLRLQDETNPTTIELVNLAVEIPLGHRSKCGWGKVSAISVSRVLPGRREDAIDLAGRTCALAERHGAVDARIFDLVAAGAGAGLMMSIWELENMSSYANVISAFGADPEGRAITSAAAEVEAPLSQVYAAVFNQVPL